MSDIQLAVRGKTLSGLFLATYLSACSTGGPNANGTYISRCGSKCRGQIIE
jgi:hypothetical protein